MKIKLLLFALFLGVNVSYSQVNEPKYELVKSTDQCQSVEHTAYTLCFKDEYKQACWVAYSLTKEHAVSSHERTNKFIVDPMVKGGTATNKDYSASGYDRGHLAPAADMGWSNITMKESFYFSNMSPQNPSFNRGIWKKLEEQVREWAIEYDKIYIAAGPILTHGLPTIGPNKVAVPQYFYKVVLDMRGDKPKAIGFIFPNAASQEPIQRYAVTVDSVEKLAHLDFFYQLSDNIQKEVESKINLASWNWSSEATSNGSHVDKGSRSTTSTSKSKQHATKSASGTHSHLHKED